MARSMLTFVEPNSTSRIASTASAGWTMTGLSGWRRENDNSCRVRLSPRDTAPWMAAIARALRGSAACFFSICA